MEVNTNPLLQFNSRKRKRNVSFDTCPPVEYHPQRKLNFLCHFDSWIAYPREIKELLEFHATRKCLSQDKPKEPVQLPGWNFQNRYRYVSTIGNGSYGCVVKAVDIKLNCEVAIKRIQNIFADLTDAHRILREIYILRNIQHEFVVKLLNVYVNDDFPTNNDIYIVMEYMPFDLSKTLKSNQYWDEQPIKYIMYQLLVGVEFLHKHKIIHRDLKPANLLLNTSVQLKIADFGLSRLISEDTFKDDMNTEIQDDCPNLSRESPPPVLRRKMTLHVYTRWYRAPELLLLRPYNEKIDIWGVGCIFAELLQMMKGNCTNYNNRQALFPGTICDLLSPDQEREIPEADRMEQLESIYKTLGDPINVYIQKINQLPPYMNIKPFSYPVNKASLQSIFPACSEKGISFLSLLLEIDPDKRPTASECLNHPYLQSISQKHHHQSEYPIETFPSLGEIHDKSTLIRGFFREINYYKQLNY
ncbi:hypothetical protein WA158_007416 [Blastocystis sp. Blastoise]